MAILAANDPNLGHEACAAQSDRIAQAVQRLPFGAPVTIMTHGFRYSPALPYADPHQRLFSPDTRKTNWKSISWAHYLHLHRRAGLGIGFGWHALGRLDEVAARAFSAGAAMGQIIRDIHAARPDLRIQLMAHSLGARVALRAMDHAPAGSIDTVLLLSGADFRSNARHAMASAAGQTARVINVTSGENLAFDGLFRLFAPGPQMLQPGLGAGLGQGHPRWLDLKIDNPAHLNALRALGHRPANPSHRICHWSSFTRPGLFPLYRDLLGPEGAASFAQLRQALPQPHSVARRHGAWLPLPGRAA